MNKPTKSFKNASNRRHKHYITNQLKEAIFQKTLVETRLKMSKQEALTSRIIHFRPIDTISNCISNYIFGPYQIIFSSAVIIIGIILFLVTSSNTLYIPNSFVLLLWSIGYMLGSIIQIFIKITNKDKNLK